MTRALVVAITVGLCTYLGWKAPVRGEGHTGDFVDDAGQDWDVKRHHSRAQLEDNLNKPQKYLETTPALGQDSAVP